MFNFSELSGIDAKPYTFSYSELRNATNDFSLDNKLGEGGFGPVYKVNILSLNRDNGYMSLHKRLSLSILILIILMATNSNDGSGKDFF